MTPIFDPGTGAQYAAGVTQPGNVSGTDIGAARANIRAAGEAEIYRRNRDETAKYHQRYDDYVTNMQSGENVPADRRQPPIPPMAWGLSLPDENGEQFPVQGNTPVCAQGPAVTANFDQKVNTEPNVMMMGIMIPGTGVYQALKGDTMPEGTVKTIPGPDGKPLTVRKHGTPWGGYWEPVAV